MCSLSYMVDLVCVCFGMVTACLGHAHRSRGYSPCHSLPVLSFIAASEYPAGSDGQSSFPRRSVHARLCLFRRPLLDRRTADWAVPVLSPDSLLLGVYTATGGPLPRPSDCVWLVGRRTFPRAWWRPASRPPSWSRCCSTRRPWSTTTRSATSTSKRKVIADAADGADGLAPKYWGTVGGRTATIGGCQDSSDG